MKAGRSKLDGYSATLPAVRPSLGSQSSWHLSHRLPLVEKPHGLIPRPEHLLNRLAADPPPLSPASTVPLAVTSTAPAISWLSEPLPPACKAGQTLLLDASKLSSMAVPYLLSFGWGKNTSHRKWYKSSLSFSSKELSISRVNNGQSPPVVSALCLLHLSDKAGYPVSAAS